MRIGKLVHDAEVEYDEENELDIEEWAEVNKLSEDKS